MNVTNIPSQKQDQLLSVKLRYLYEMYNAKQYTKILNVIKHSVKQLCKINIVISILNFE